MTYFEEVKAGLQKFVTDKVASNEEPDYEVTQVAVRHGLQIPEDYAKKSRANKIKTLLSYVERHKKEIDLLEAQIADLKQEN